MAEVPLGLLIGLGAMAGVALGATGVLLSGMAAAGFLLLDTANPRGIRRVMMAVVVVVVAASVGAWRGTPASPAADPRLLSAASAIGTVRSMPQPGGRLDTALVTLESATLADGTAITLDLPVLASFPASVRANVGDRIALGGEFTPLDGLAPGYRHAVAGRQAAGVFMGYGATLLATGSSPLRPLVDLRRTLTDRIRRAIPGDAGALASGVVTGDDSALGEETADAFRTAGLSHVTAVSGQNIAILAGVLGLLLRGRARRMVLVHALTLVAVWAYVGMTGFGPPAIRAGIFVSAAFVAIWLGRRPDFLTILALTSGGMLLVCPAYVASVSFWLSMAASAALITVFGPSTSGAHRWWVRSVMALVAAQLATVPIAIAVFGTWSLGSVPANLIAAPLMQAAFPLCFLLAVCLLALPFAAPPVALMAELPLLATIATATAMASALPASDLAAGGIAVAMAAAIPCVGAAALLSEDVRRWGRRLHRAVGGDAASIVAAVAGIVAGIVLALLVMRGLVR